MKTIIASILIFAISTLFGCHEKGDYQYIIQMKDSSEVKAWSVSSRGGGLTVFPAWGEGDFYYLSSKQYIRADYVGSHNKNE